MVNGATWTGRDYCCKCDNDNITFDCTFVMDTKGRSRGEGLVPLLLVHTITLVV